MPTLEEDLRQHFLGREPSPIEGLSERGNFVYRRQIRNALKSGVLLAIPILVDKLGDDAVDELLERWMAEAPPTSRLYWKLPLEFAEWIQTLEELPHPAAAELVHFETIEVDVINAPDDPTDRGEAHALAPKHCVVLSESARMGIYFHPVHPMREGSPWPERSVQPHFVMVYRRDERMRYEEVPAHHAQLLAKLGEGVTIESGFDFLRGLYGDAIDPNELLTHLQRYAEIGIIHEAREEAG